MPFHVIPPMHATEQMFCIIGSFFYDSLLLAGKIRLYLFSCILFLEEFFFYFSVGLTDYLEIMDFLCLSLRKFKDEKKRKQSVV